MENDMDFINAVSTLDGNQYLVNNTVSAVNDGQQFDKVYEKETQKTSLDDIFNEAASEYGVNAELIKAVARAESGFDAQAVSRCGAKGIMQLMPSTAKSLGVTDPFDARQSIMGGTKMLAYLLNDYNGNASLALAAYNAGSGSVKKYGGVPPYKETLNYINKINGYLNGALSNDSTRTTDAQATDFTVASATHAPDINKSMMSDSSVQAYDAGNAAAPQYNEVSDTGRTGADDTEDMTGISSDSSLFTYSDYLKFLKTYESIIKKLMSELSDYNDDEKNMYSGSALKQLYDITDSKDTSLFGNTDKTSGVLNSTGSQLSVNNEKIARYRTFMNI